MNNKYELYHYGVKGMKWGVIRKKVSNAARTVKRTYYRAQDKVATNLRKYNSTKKLEAHRKQMVREANRYAKKRSFTEKATGYGEKELAYLSAKQARYSALMWGVSAALDAGILQAIIGKAVPGIGALTSASSMILNLGAAGFNYMSMNNSNLASIRADQLQAATVDVGKQYTEQMIKQAKRA